MNLYVYSDESGVFDRRHNKYYVYGGLIFLNKESRDIASRKYRSIEREISNKYPSGAELKASAISGQHKRRLFSATNHCIRFGAVIDQEKVNANFYDHKKSKQRYLDYVYKLALKDALKRLKIMGALDLDDVKNIIIYADEHTTATDAIYELREAIYQELRIGTSNFDYNVFFPPILKNLISVDLKLCDSKKYALVRASDVIANTIYRSVISGKELSPGMLIRHFPK